MAVTLSDWINYVQAGFLLLLAIVWVPERVLLFLGRYVSPNWLSVAHVLIAWAAYLLYLQGHLFWGLQIMVFAAALDRIDGRLATVLDDQLRKLKGLKETEELEEPEGFWVRMNHKGSTILGKTVDPLMDKVAVSLVYAHICWRFLNEAELAEGHLGALLGLGTILIALMFIVEISGQAVRMDRFKKYRHQEDNGATWVGKLKSLAQWAWLVLYPVWDHGWLKEHEVIYLLILDAFLLVIIVLAVMSVLSKLYSFKHEWTKSFHH